MKKLLIIFLVTVYSLSLNAAPMSNSSNEKEIWTIKWFHTQPPNHPTRDIIFTEIDSQSGKYSVHFNNGVEGYFHLNHLAQNQFTGNMILIKSEQLPDGDVCTLTGEISAFNVNGTWSCESQHSGTFSGSIKHE